MTFDVIIGRSKHDIEKLGKEGTVFIAKQYVKMGQTTSLSNPVYLDVAGAHVIFLCGKRGSGKCLHGDSLIQLEDGSQVKIKELEKNKQKIITIDEKLKTQIAPKTHFYKRKVKELLHLKLRSGKEIKLTPEHPLLTVKGWVQAKNLPISSRIATPRTIPTKQSQTKIKKGLKLHETKLLAYLIAEGHLGNGFVLFTNKDEKILNEFKSSIKKFDKTLTINNHSSEYTLRVVQYNKRSTNTAKRNTKGQFEKGSTFSHKTSIRKWLEKLNLYNKDSYTKHIPKEIFTLENKLLSIFLNRLFSCDGTIYQKNKHWHISYASASKDIIQSVQSLLLRFDILSKFKQKTIKGFESYELYIYGENVTKYLQYIGFFGTKEVRAKQAQKDLKNITHNPNIDTIPKEIWDLYTPKNWAEIGRKLNYKHPKALRESTRYAPSREKLGKIAKADNVNLLKTYAQSDIFWDEITNINLIEGNFEVYDLTVPNTHNFIANDIVVHNSYTMGSIAEGLADLPKHIKQNLSIVLLDTMGIYWTMKYPNYQDAPLLKEWGFDPKPLDVKIYTPTGFYYKYKDEGIPTDFPFSLTPIDVGPEDWLETFKVPANSAEGVLLSKVVQNANNVAQETNTSYDLDHLINLTREDQESEKVTKSVVINLFEKAKGWKIFDKNGTPLKDIVKGGQVTVLDVSPYATMPSGWEIKAMVTGLLCKRLFQERMLSRKSEEFQTVDKAMHYFSKETKEKQEEPLVWVAIDEAHELLPREGKTAASDALITILREGRQPGISLILATQQPGKIHTDVMTQSDIVLSHRLTAKMDVEALGLLMQSYMRTGLDVELNNLPRQKGAAILFDDNNERLFPIQMRPRFTWHGGSSPTAVKAKQTKATDILKQIKDLE